MNRIMLVGLLGALLLWGCTPARRAPLQRDSSFCKKIDYRTPFPAKQIIYLNVKSTFNKNQKLKRGQNLAEFLPRPELKTDSDALFRQASTLYYKRKYSEALKTTQKLYYKEPQNPFVLEQYAKILYRLEKREESFEFYSRLMKHIHEFETGVPAVRITAAKNSSQKKNVIINVWFLDAYWKLGTLYMDRKQYDKAILNIRKLLDTAYLARGVYQPRQKLFVEQALSYLTEAYYHQKDLRANRFFYCETLKINPRNRYIQHFLR